MTVEFCGKAEIGGFLGPGNEQSEERILRRERFWKSFGVELDYEKRRIRGDLKKIVGERLKILPDVQELKLKEILKALKR